MEVNNDTEDTPIIINDEDVLAAEQFEFYTNVVLSPVGIILNLLSFVIFCKIKSYNSATGTHLMCIAIADNCVIIGTFLEQSLIYTQFSKIPDLPSMNIFLCKGNAVFHSGSILWSGLLLVSATVERFLCVAFPLKVQNWNMLKISRILNIIYFLVSFAVNGPVTYGHHFSSEQNFTFYQKKLYDVTSFVSGLDLIVNSVVAGVIIPIIILIFTTSIAILLFRAKARRNTLSKKMTSNENREFKITFMLFIVAILFLITRIFSTIIWEIGGNSR